MRSWAPTSNSAALRGRGGADAGHGVLADILRAHGLRLFVGRRDLLGGTALLLDLSHGFLQLFDRVVGQRSGLHDRVEDLLGVVLDVVVQVTLEASNVRYRNVVQRSGRSGPDRDNLPLDR